MSTACLTVKYGTSIEFRSDDVACGRQGILGVVRVFRKKLQTRKHSDVHGLYMLQ